MKFGPAEAKTWVVILGKCPNFTFTVVRHPGQNDLEEPKVYSALISKLQSTMWESQDSQAADHGTVTSEVKSQEWTDTSLLPNCYCFA